MGMLKMTQAKQVPTVFGDEVSGTRLFSQSKKFGIGDIPRDIGWDGVKSRKEDGVGQ